MCFCYFCYEVDTKRLTNYNCIFFLFREYYPLEYLQWYCFQFPHVKSFVLYLSGQSVNNECVIVYRFNFNISLNLTY